MKKIGLFAAGVLFDTAETPEKAAETPAESIGEEPPVLAALLFPYGGEPKV